MINPRSLEHYLGVSYFVHPIPLTAVALMVVNDHFLKHQYASWWTGKLSDFAGVFFFPLFLCALLNLFRNLWTKENNKFHWINRRQLLWGIVVTDLIFVGVKISFPVREMYLSLMASIGVPSEVTADVSDLLALAMNPLTYGFGRRFLNPTV